jgi:hypothetical protein
MISQNRCCRGNIFTCYNLKFFLVFSLITDNDLKSTKFKYKNNLEWIYQYNF